MWFKIKRILFKILFFVGLIAVSAGMNDLEISMVLGGGILIGLSLFMLYGPYKKQK